MEPVYAALTTRAQQLHASRASAGGHDSHLSGRTIIGLAGPPGSGKSTIAAEVVRRVNEAATAAGSTPYAVVLAMDGFHYAKKVLDGLPNRAEAYARRGAAWTFDANGVLALVRRLSESRTCPAADRGNARSEATRTAAAIECLCNTPIVAPSFSHAEKDPVQDAIQITRAMELIILEGNWLFLDEEPWRHIRDYVDDAWFVDVEPALARERIVKRHLEAGIETTVEAATKRAEENDLVNGELVRTKLVGVNIRIESVEDKREEMKESQRDAGVMVVPPVQLVETVAAGT